MTIVEEAVGRAIEQRDSESESGSKRKRDSDDESSATSSGSVQALELSTDMISMDIDKILEEEGSVDSSTFAKEPLGVDE